MGCWSIDSSEHHERTQEPLDTSPRQPKQQFQGQPELDTWVGVGSLAASLARWQWYPGSEGRWREPDGEVSATDQCPVVLWPVRDAVLGLGRWVDLRTLGHHPLHAGARDVHDKRVAYWSDIDSCTNAAPTPR